MKQKPDRSKEVEDAKIREAMKDSRIRAWINQFPMNRERSEDEIFAWMMSPKQQYNLRSAILQGMRPTEVEPGEWHWSDLDVFGQPLKSPKHPTYKHTLQDLAPMPSSAEQVEKFLFGK